MTLRDIGENPQAVDTKAINVKKFNYLAVIFGDLMEG